jgi:hypothetical protein
MRDTAIVGHGNFAIDTQPGSFRPCGKASSFALRQRKVVRLPQMLHYGNGD